MAIEDQTSAMQTVQEEGRRYFHCLVKDIYPETLTINCKIESHKCPMSIT
jgi:ribosome biogenesis GTPase A